MTKKRKVLFPALRCAMGDSIYYATFMSFADITAWIKPTDEVHKSKRLSEWIQRRLMGGHALKISRYLVNQDERFFNAIVVGIYGGQPTWSALDVMSRPGDEDPDIQEYLEDLETSIGLLQLTGDENLFAIDGQHRVAGIKMAMKESETVSSDEIVVIFVGHELSAVGQERTRRLFTTLNKTAKSVSAADRIALDEDDGFAIVTRWLVNDFELFAETSLIEFARSAALSSKSKDSLTTIVSLYNQVCDLYWKGLTSANASRSTFRSTRPTDEAIEDFCKACENYWRLLSKEVAEVSKALSGKVKPGDYRREESNHLLFRPVGQRAFAKASGVMIGRGYSMQDAVVALSGVEFWIHKRTWHHILWDPVQKIMLKNSTIAASYLLHLIGQEPSSPASKRNLQERLRQREL